jgi:hypothetical protein
MDAEEAAGPSMDAEEAAGPTIRSRPTIFTLRKVSYSDKMMSVSGIANSSLDSILRDPYFRPFIMMQ